MPVPELGIRARWMAEVEPVAAACRSVACFGAAGVDTLVSSRRRMSMAVFAGRALAELLRADQYRREVWLQHAKGAGGADGRM